MLSNDLFSLVKALFRIIGISAFLVLMMVLPSTVEASHNQNLYVSAENSRFNNHFAGSMVIQVVVSDSSIADLDDAVGEPAVTLNGKKLRMVQTSDGNWYAYFANKEKAQEADDIASSGVTGKGLDFGVFCGQNTSSSVFGISFSDAEGVAISTTDISGTTNGKSSFNTCTGTPGSPTSTINNVVRHPQSLNQNSNVGVGQIGIDADIWPVVQLFSFSNDVTIMYNRAGGTQSVTLHYDDIENISINLDRTSYPTNSDVIATIYDMQLNQDPTDEDSWTFTAGSTQKTFYYAFTKSGSNAANEGTGLINIVSKLSDLGFEKNGKLSLSLGNIAELKTNQIQPSSSVSDGTTTFSNIVTFAETEPNSGIFINSDHQGKSNIKISSSAPRGQSAIIEYNSKSASIVSGTTTASISLGGSNAAKSMQLSTLIPGKKFAVTLVDPDQNLSSIKKDDFHVYNSTAIIPSIQIGNPITLEKTSAVKLFLASGTDLTTDGISSISFRVNDTNSDILLIDTRNAGTTNFEKISINLGITADSLKDLLIDDDETDTDGTNWINYDFRSFQHQLGINDFSDTTMTLYFGSLSGSSVTILDKGDISSAQDLVQIDNEDVVSIKSKTGTVFLVVNFDSTSDTDGAGRIASETDRQPIVFDLFSFGESSSEPINNAKYRLELKESEANSGSFIGSMEISQSNQFDSSFVSTLQTISDDIKLLINQRLLDERGIDLKYSDIASAGVNYDVSSQTDVRTNDGKVTLNQRTFRFGQPVKVILIDPDLNQKHDTIDIYLTSNDPNSDNVDAVIDQGGNLLLEIKIKDVRYKRCTMEGVETGGLASAGFTLVETGTSTGIFEGIFRMPTKICNSDGTRLISPAGGSIEVKYHDALDSSGKPNIFGLTFTQSTSTAPRVDEKVPDWLKTNVRAWVDKKTDDYTFLNGIQYLINENIISPSNVQEGKSEKKIPSWIRNNADWWSNGLITQDDYLRGIEYLIEKGVIKLP